MDSGPIAQVFLWGPSLYLSPFSPPVVTPLLLYDPVNLYVKNFPEKDPLCFFCGVEDESVPHLFWGLCSRSYILEEILFVCTCFSLRQFFFDV